MIERNNISQQLRYHEEGKTIATITISKIGSSNKWIIKNIKMNEFVINDGSYFEEKFEWYEKIKEEVDNYIKILK